MPRSSSPRKSSRVALGVELREPLDRLVAAREERQHRADALHAAERRRGRRRAGPSAARARRRRAGSRSRRSTERPAAVASGFPLERPGLVDVAGRREALHHLGAAAERGERQAAADDLAEHGQVGQHAEPLLRAAARDAEAGDHLVEDEQRAARVAEQPQRLEEARRRRDAAHVPGDRLDEDRREALAVPLDRRGDAVDVVVLARRSCRRSRRSARPATTGCRASRGPSRRSRGTGRRGRGSSRRT